MNKIAVSGRLTREPKVRYTPNGKILCQFTLAVQREYQNAEGVYEADFLPVILWGNSAEVGGNNLSKGSKILVEGRIQTRSYVDKQNVKHWVTELVARRFEYMFSNPASTGKSSETETVETPFDNIPEPDFDLSDMELPF